MTAVHILPDPRAVGERVARRIADRIDATAGDFYLGCPGGRSPVTTYAALADEAKRRELDLARVHIVMMDDYVMGGPGRWRRIPADRHNSCERFAQREIRDVLNRGLMPSRQIPLEQVYLPDPGDPSAYDRLLESVGGIDFFILATGAGDGHVAFNPPGTDADSRTAVVQLARQTRIDNLATFPDFAGLDEVPTHGVTVGVGTIASTSHEAALVVHGLGKREAYRRLTSVTGYDSQWPATVVHLVPGGAIYADAAAAGGHAGQDATSED
ncbi:MAG: 6-phosphogluconolactonase [Nostocoides sp.]